MKIKINNSILILMLMTIFSSSALTQTPSGYLCSVRNDSLLTSKIYEFDIYLQNSDPINIFELATFQAGILVNSSIVNSGTITPSIVAGSSQLVTAQRPTSISFAGSPDFVIKLAPRLGPGLGAGTIIPLSAPGTRVARIRLTNTADFGQFSPDFTFNFTALPYNTIVSAYDQTSAGNVVITNSTNHTVATMINPILNGPITAYNVTGGGTAPATVGLNGSQTGGVNYLLYKGGVPQGSSINGTGSSLSFGSQTAGTYTVTAHRKATYMYSGMSGSAIVTAPCVPVGIGAQPTGNSMCATSGNVSFTVVASGESPFTYQWQYYNGSSWVNTTNGTPSGASYTNSTTATLNVAGITASGSYLYHCILTNCSGVNSIISNSVTLTVNPNPTVNAGGVLTAICQSGTTAALGGSFGGGATAAVWSDGGAGGSFTNNSGATPGTTTYTASASAPASVTLTLTTSGGSCGTTSASKVLTVNPNPIVNVGGATSAICQGGTTGALGGSFGGGATSAVWSDGGAGGSFANNAGGTPNTATYTASPVSGTPVTLRLTTSGGSCGTTFATKLLTVNAMPTVNTGGALAAICQGGNTIALGGSYGGSATSAVWSDGGAGGSFANNSGSTPGTTTYTASSAAPPSVTLTLTTAGGSCGTTSASKVLTVNPSPTVSVDGATAAICQSGTTAALGGSFGGSATSAVWSDGGAGGSFTNNSGATPGTTTYTASASAPASVTLTLTTAGGSCGTTSASKVLTVNPNPTVNVGGAIAAICQGGTTGALGGSFGGGATAAVWSDGGAGGSFANNGGSTPGTATYTASAVSGTPITLRLTTSGGSCGTTFATKLLTVNPIPAAPTIGTITQPTCSVATGSVILSGLPAGIWIINPGSIGGSTTTTTISSLIAGNYNFTVTNSLGCISPASGNVVINSQPATPATPTISASGPVTFCTGGSVTLTSSAGTTYLWSTGATTQSIAVTSSGSYTVRITDAIGCQSAPSLATVVTVNTLPVQPTITAGGPTTFCTGGSVTLTSSAGSSYLWSTGAITASIIVSTPGSYTVQVTNAGGCQSAASLATVVTVNTLPAIPTITAGGPTTFCIGGSVILTSSAGTSYLWSTGATTASITVTTPGSYTVQVTNAGGCLSVASLPTLVAVNALPATPTITASGPTAICAGSTLTLTSSTGTTYLWSTGAITPSINVTAAGGYTVRITNANGCQSAPSLPTTVTVNPIPTPTISSSDPDNYFCQNSSVTFTATGGTTYSFRVAGIIQQTGLLATFTTSALLNGQVVDVIAFNAIGCSATSTGITNFINPLPVFYLSTSPTCSPDYSTYSLGVTVVGSGTVTSTSGIVTNTGSNVWTITGVLKGVNVTVRVTDVNLCESVLVVTAPNCDCPIMAAPVSGGDRSYCELGVIPTINATVLAGETIDWYISSSGGTPLRVGSLSYTPASAGTYYALARNISSSCVSSTRTAVRVIMNPLPIPSLTSSDADNIICSGASVTFTAGGGTSYNFRVGGASVQNGATATYTTSSLTNNQLVDVIVTNASGCVATSASITNTVNAVPVPTLTSSDADNRFCAGTSVTFTAGGGTSYSFRIGGIAVQSGASATYTTTSLTDNQVVDVIVTNASGCSATSAGITNTVFTSLTATLTSSDADNIFCSGTSVTFTSTGGTSYNFRVGGVSVQNSTSATYTTSSLTNGQTVDVIASNVSGCAAISAAITNTVNPSPTANAGTGGDECDLDFIFKAVASIGTGTWTLTSGPGTVTYAPNSNSPAATATVSEYGTYTFTWTEISGSCSKSSTITVNFYQQPVASAGTGGNNCGLEFNLNGTLNMGIGTWSKVSGPGDVTFAPDANSAAATVTVTKFGSYIFRWSVVNGTCSNSTTVSVNFIQQIAANAGSDGSECDKDFVLNAQVPTGTGTWTKVSGPGNAVFSPDNHQPGAKVTVDQFGTYRFAWTVANISCTSSDIVEVVFHNLPSINAGIDKELCKGSSIQLIAQGVGTFAWSPAALVNNPAISNPIATPVTSATFTVVLTDQFGCKNSDGVLVEVREKPVANAGPDQVLEYLFETTMEAVLYYPYETGVWSVVEGSGSFDDIKNPRTLVDSLSVGVNKFLWTVKNKVCPSSSDSVRLEVHDFVIPTLITPNMDGNNDYFVLRGLSTLGKTELIIFDRRGAQVYKNSNYDNLWNGVDYNENPLAEDTYYYVIKSENGKSLSGYIVIRR